jgi:hypothetical protein
MQIIRGHILSRAIALITGLIFLNLSFILTEMNALELKQSNSTLYEYIAKLLSGSGFEEEKDSTGETSENGSEKEIKVFHQFTDLAAVNGHLIVSQLYQPNSSQNLLPGNSEITTPPPKG